MVDLDSLSSNDIGAIMDTYGVEAGRACIIKEINSIFGMYCLSLVWKLIFKVFDFRRLEAFNFNRGLHDVRGRLQTL
jgi:DNA-directed RNA polymerase I subunit RPA1